jgi:hypothetical protein
VNEPVLFALGVALFMLAVPGQSLAATLAPEDRVRVTILARTAAPETLFTSTGLEPGERIVGRYLFSDRRIFELRDDDRPRTIPTEAIASVEKSLGRRSSAGRGAFLGAVIGLVSGVAVGLYIDSTENLGTGTEGFAPFALGVGGGLAGCGLGALVGSQVKRDQWQPVWTTEEGATR